MSNGRKIILHTGMPKTGTSSIQNTLHANRGFLFQQEGVLYPSLAPNLTTALRTIFRDLSDQPIANKMSGLTHEEEAVRRKNYQSALDEEIASRDWDTLLLSGEGMSVMLEPEFTKLREWGEKYASDWTVLVCVRHPVAYTRSMIQQLMKSGDTLRQTYEDLPTPNFRKRISRIASVFGQQSIRVFDFDAAARSEGGIVGAFAKQAGLGTASNDFLVSRAESVNESLSSEAAHILDSLNRQRPMFVDDVRAPRRAGPGRELPYLKRIKGRKFDLPEMVKENIRLQSRDDVAYLNETFGLNLYEDILDSSSNSESREKPAETSSDLTVDSIAGVIGDLVTTTTFDRLLKKGKVALVQGHNERATEAFREASRLHPDAPQSKDLLEQAILRAEEEAH